MRNWVWISFVLLLLSVSSNAQQLLIRHKQSGKEFRISPGDKLSITYKGYLNQIEKLNLPVTYVTDSSVCFGSPIAKGSADGNSYAEKHGLLFKEVLLRDIQFFRRISLGRQVLKSTLTIGASIGTIILFAETLDIQNMTILRRTAISLGFGLGTKLLINGILPEYPKNRMADYSTQLIY